MTERQDASQTDGQADGQDAPEGFDSLRAELDARARAQRLALAAERAAAAFWPTWTVLAAFMGLALTGAFEALPRLGHLAALGLFGLGLAAAVLWGLRRFRMPTAAEALAALDHDMADRPVAAFHDDIAIGAGDAGARALWAAHRARVAKRAAAARPRPAQPRLAARDPFALRLSAMVLLAMGGLVAMLDGGERFVAAFTPGAPAPAAAATAPAVEAWAAPPAYTGAEMVYLTERMGEEISLPAGSRLSLRVYNAPGDPSLSGDLDLSAEAAAGLPLGPGAQEYAFALSGSGRLAVMGGTQELAAWTFAATPDAAPEIDFTTEATATETRALQFGFAAADDYGVTSAWATITLDRARLPNPGGRPPQALEPIRVELPLSFTGAETDVEEQLVEDLTAHPWAGLPVLITLTAEDAAGQQGSSPPLEAAIPPRIFSDPMARAFLEERRAFAADITAARDALQRLRAVTAWPEDWFGESTGPYLVARTAMRRLGYALEDGREEAEALSVMELLWRAALLLEAGDLASAAERLARAQERLQEAIDRGATPEEIAKLMDELRQAMNEYLQEMMRQAMQNLDQMEQQQQNGQQQSMDMQDLQRMLDELQRAAEAGDREAAQQLLQQLAQILQNLQMQAQQGQGQGQQQGQGGQMMEQLQDMLRGQQDLADRSFGEMQRRQGEEGGRPGSGNEPGNSPYGRPNRGGMTQEGLEPGTGNQRGGGGGEQGDQQGAPGGQGQESMGDLAQRQEALRRALEDLRAQLPDGLSEEAERALGDAERSMEGARDSLRGDQPDAALDDQVQAMEQLREGARQLGEAMQQQAQRGQGDRAGQGSPNGRDRAFDPTGRPVARDGSPDGGDTRVPTEEELKRARELLDEIRRRSGERTRPELELDYLRRLLDRF
ncbi:TIGR02302 family protein [Rhodovulum sp. DZ06]|uniref:TIGR02302 family protein n=1 Tax=Rhodovulum sp. DZ06 TaxID=3425126 RepID=UPI003D3248CA